MSPRMPTLYLPHGGGPWPFVEMGLSSDPGYHSLLAFLRSVPAMPPEPPRALLVVSAHWEESRPTVTTSDHPPLLFDYSGFPPESYRLSWPAPGDPKLAVRVRTLLDGAGFETGEDPRRGFDHGTFVPLKISYPEATLPVVQLSLVRGLDPATHLRMGRALAPLREEGVFILGSGMSYHDLRGFFRGGAREVSEGFDAWLRSAATAAPVERDAQLTEWSRAPLARQAHPREEHLLPLMVVAGAAGDDRGTLAYDDVFMGVRLSAYRYAA